MRARLIRKNVPRRGDAMSERIADLAFLMLVIGAIFEMIRALGHQ